MFTASQLGTDRGMQREPFRTVVYLGEVLDPASLGVLCSVSDRKSLSFIPQACIYYHGRHCSRSWDVVGKMNFLPLWSSYSGEDCLRLVSPCFWRSMGWVPEVGGLGQTYLQSQTMAGRPRWCIALPVRR